MYSILLDGLLKKVSDEVSFFPNAPVLCFQNTRYVKQNIDHLDAIPRLAFTLLFSLEKELSLVFTDREIARYGFEPHRTFSLTSGLLTERKHSAVVITSSTFSFVHKSMQEFLAAFYIVRNKHVIDDVISKYLDNFPEDMFSISQTFVFVCGLDNEASYALSCVMDDRVTTADFYEYPELIISGYIEAMANNIDGDLFKLKISEIDFDMSLEPLNIEDCFHSCSGAACIAAMQKCHCFESLLKLNKGNLRRLDISDGVYVTEIGDQLLSTVNLRDILLSSADCLEHLDITFTNIVLSSLTSTKKIIHSGIGFEIDAWYINTEIQSCMEKKLDVFITDPNIITKLLKLKSFTIRYFGSSYEQETFPIEMLFPGSNQFDIHLPSSKVCQDISLPSATAYQEINLPPATAYQDIFLPSSKGSPYTHMPTSAACHDISLPSSIENITLIKISVSSVWLRLLLKKLSLFGHCVNITLDECFIQSINADEQKRVGIG
ncbi:hypothetical protein DPMN_038697 [Dreissena polymorpha]|uniref:Uncharacterized protein n=1 Tax=Dreissena polymorpha TaxID=45954 RepID=A0A9D4RNG4_DREPO|nr:hypothetical protein DPMN_038697 [Dreissena polymorpha]